MQVRCELKRTSFMLNYATSIQKLKLGRIVDKAGGLSRTLHAADFRIVKL